jgi:anti-sigma regulatory factor (Ser/Thr protein kinase)/putative methionine-R-sulfoxide reductase with GAF domain
LAVDDPDRTPHAQRRTGAGQVFLGASEPPTGQQAEQLLHMYRLSDPALSELALEPLLDELLVRAKTSLDVDTVAILLHDEDTHELVARAAKGLEEEVEQGVRIPIGKGFAGRIAAERMPIFIADVAHADVLNPILREKGVRSLLGVPIVVEGRLIGVMHVGALRPREFTNDDAALLQLAAAHAGPAIDRARLYSALDREHRVAVALQQSLLPDRLPDLVGVDAAARYLPARDEVGGDWYDVIELPHGLVGVAIGDVAGHGVRAASLMGQLRTGLRAYALDGHGPGEVLKRLDRLLQTIRTRGMATAAYAIVDPTTGAMRCAWAGHPPPVIVSPDGEARIVEIKPAPPLGTLRYSSYPEIEAQLEPDETLVLYTDGLIESRAEPLTVGLERLREAASVVRSAEGLCRHITHRLVAGAPANDDIAIVAVRLQPVGADMRMRFAADPHVLAPIRQMLRRWLHAQEAADEDVVAMTLACNEACANAIEHAYAPGAASFEIEAVRALDLVTLAVRDAGSWRPPRGSHRGRGLAMIEAAVDEVEVKSTDGGTEVLMRRRLRS